MKRYLILNTLLLGVLLLASGCASQVPKGPQIKSLSVLPVNVQAFEWSDSSKPARRPDWEPEIAKVVMESLKKNLSSEGIEIQTSNFSSSTIESHTSAKVGTVMKATLPDSQPDFLLRVSVNQTISTTGRKVGKGIVNTLSFSASMLVGLATFGAVVPFGFMEGGKTTIGMALIDNKTGNQIWDEHVTATEEDLRDHEDAADLLGYVLRLFPSEKLRSE